MQNINAIVIATTMLFLLFLSLASGAAASNEPLSLKGQAISGHQVISSDQGSSVVEFFTAKPVPGGQFWSVMRDAILDRQDSQDCQDLIVVSIAWHGDNKKRRHFRNPFKVDAFARRVERDVEPPIGVYRPHSYSKFKWRRREEIRLHLALVDYISRTFCVGKFNLLGKSSGGTVAIAIAHERPHLTAMVGLASPVLAIKARHRQQYSGNIPARVYSQYDPIDHIGKLSPDIPVLVVYDRRDKLVRYNGVIPYIKKAQDLGLKVKLFEVQVHEINDASHHNTSLQLGHALKTPENADFRPWR